MIVTVSASIRINILEACPKVAQDIIYRGLGDGADVSFDAMSWEYFTKGLSSDLEDIH